MIVVAHCTNVYHQGFDARAARIKARVAELTGKMA